MAAVVLAGGVWATIHLTPLVWWLGEPLRLSASDANADAILVLAGGVGESGEAGQGYEERVAHAIDLYRQGRAPRMVFSSGITRTFRETEVMQLLAVNRGVPAEVIFEEKNGGGIHQSALSLGDLARSQGWRNILLVTSPYNMRRAVGAWERTNPDLPVYAVPSTRSDFYSYQGGEPPQAGGASLRQTRAILDEWFKWVLYKFQGWS